MSKLKITAGPFTFDARLETEAAPKTCAAFLRHMPFKHGAQTVVPHPSKAGRRIHLRREIVGVEAVGLQTP